jgi:hypothetical protein
MGVNFSTSSDKKYVTELDKKKGDKKDKDGNPIEGEDNDKDNDQDQDETETTTIDENAITIANLNKIKNENAKKENNVTTTITDKKIPDDPNHQINQYVREFIDKKTQADTDINTWCADNKCAEMEAIKVQMIKEFEDLIEAKKNLKPHLKAKYRGLKGGADGDDEDEEEEEEEKEEEKEEDEEDESSDEEEDESSDEEDDDDEDEEDESSEEEDDDESSEEEEDDDESNDEEEPTEGGAPTKDEEKEAAKKAAKKKNQDDILKKTTSTDNKSIARKKWLKILKSNEYGKKESAVEKNNMMRYDVVNTYFDDYYEWTTFIKTNILPRASQGGANEGPSASAAPAAPAQTAPAKQLDEQVFYMLLNAVAEYYIKKTLNMPITGEKEIYEKTGKAYKTLKGTGGEENVDVVAQREGEGSPAVKETEPAVTEEPSVIKETGSAVEETGSAVEETGSAVEETGSAVTVTKTDGGQFSGGGLPPTKRLTRKKHLKHKKPKHIKISINIGDKNHISASESSSSSSDSSSEEEEEEEATKIVPKKKRMSRRRRN